MLAFTGCLSCLHRAESVSLNIFSLVIYWYIQQSLQATKIQRKLVVILKNGAHKAVMFIFESLAMISICTWGLIHSLYRFVYVFPQTKRIIKRYTYLLNQKYK